jgi:hypothetical protein
LPDLWLVGRQKRTDGGPLDLLGVDAIGSPSGPELSARDLRSKLARGICGFSTLDELAEPRRCLRRRP